MMLERFTISISEASLDGEAEVGLNGSACSEIKDIPMDSGPGFTARCKETPTNTSIEGDQATPPACAVFNAFTVEHSSVL